MKVAVLLVLSFCLIGFLSATRTPAFILAEPQCCDPVASFSRGGGLFEFVPHEEAP
ncbi:MAG TPA: hypothetical protein VN048_00495 [Verrucomicrobiae bacterium]|jgi:hypothetical protein|nr:hypothetical protein [Verrucomicrobiae bacterium]